MTNDASAQTCDLALSLLPPDPNTAVRPTYLGTIDAPGLAVELSVASSGKDR